MSQRDYAKAAVAFRGAVERRPFDRESLRLWGRALTQIGDQDGAVSAMRRILAIDPEDAGAHEVISFSLGALGRVREAKDHADAVLKYLDILEPHRRDAFANRHPDADREARQIHFHTLR